MIVRVLVEGPSEDVLLRGWAPRAFPGHEFRVHPHGGKGSLPRAGRTPDRKKTGLLDLLPVTLTSLARARPDDAVVVLVDADDDDCAMLLADLKRMAADLEARPKRLVFRIAIEETEAFYLGDLRALRAAFPEANMAEARTYAPDSVVGTAELFARIVNDGGLNKTWWAEEMAPRLTIHARGSRSPSFKKLIAGIERVLTPSESTRKRRPKKHWKTRHSATRKVKA
jgi:hypothetical protein